MPERKNRSITEQRIRQIIDAVLNRRIRRSQDVIETIIQEEAIDALDEIPDVHVPSPADDEVLTWNDSTQRWEAVPLPAIALDLDDLEDVTVPSPADDEVLTWNAATSRWEAEALPAIALDLDDLDDVNVPNPDDGDHLEWDNSTSRWIAAAPPAGGGGGVELIGIQVFEADGTWTKPADLAYIVVDVVSGGGGGGGSGNSGSNAGGGGGGGYARKQIAEATLGASETVTIGSGGAGGAAVTGGAAGGDGDPSSFGSHVTVTGGQGGGASGSAGFQAQGGSSTDGDINIEGQSAADRLSNATGTSAGGDSPAGYGFGGVPRLSGSSIFANPGTGFGGGGGGSSLAGGGSPRVGAPGADGIVVVYEYGTP